MKRTVLLIPGWHEKAHDLRTIVHGRNPLAGLEGRGFEALVFPLRSESLPARIGRFARFLRDLKRREAARFPVSVFGYSMGGIVARGVLRRYPDLARDIAHLVLLATPNWGLPMGRLARLARLVGLPWRELYNIDPENTFLPWLNGCTGSWARRNGTRVFVPDREPWLAPPNVPVFAVAGVVPRFRDGDGLVTVDSATMGGRFPSSVVGDRHANHLNLTGETDTLAVAVRGFLRTDAVWPRVLDAACSFMREEQQPVTAFRATGTDRD